MLIETLTLSLLIGKFRGGKIRNLEWLNIKGWYLFVISFILEMISLLIVSRSNGKLSGIIENKFFYIHIIVYLFLILGLSMNIREKGLLITLLGSILNFIPLLGNEGRMPVSIKGLKSSSLYEQLTLLEEGKILTHTLSHKGTKLYYLSDIIPISRPYPFPKIISIGDLIIAIGLFVLIQHYMMNNSKRGKMITISYSRK